MGYDEDKDIDNPVAPAQTPSGASEGKDITEGRAGDNPAAERAGIYDKPDESELKEIEEERERRLDPDNRPEGAEVDNSDAELPTVKAFAQRTKDEEVEGSAGSSDPGQAFREMEVSDEEQKEMEEERERRLDPDNRPEGAEVDNTGRTFEDGEFKD